MIVLHDPHHYTMGQLIMYGKEVIYAKSSSVSGSFSAYTVEPLEVNHVSKDDRPCISEEDQEEDAPDIWECLSDHMHSKMNCTLPWKQKANEKDVHLCSAPQEHNMFYTKVVKGAREYNSEYIDVLSCETIWISHSLRFSLSQKITKIHHRGPCCWCYYCNICVGVFRNF